MPMIALSKLHPDPRNANIVPPETLAKLTTNIQRTRLCPTLQVRPHPERVGEYILLDGHHRKQVLESLGWTEADCQILEVDDHQAGLYLLTLNRLRGVDHPRKRAELIQELLPVWDLEELSLLLPESTAEMDGLLAMLKLDEEAQDAVLREQVARESASLPVPLGFMIPAEDFPIVQEALNQYQAHSKADQSQALVAICRDVLARTHEAIQDG